MDIQNNEPMEQRTKMMPIGEVSPEFLEEWLQKTNSFYIDADDGLPRGVLNYGTDYDGKNIMFYTAGNEPKDNSLICDTIISYPGGDWGENVYRELGNRLEHDFHIDIKNERNTVNADKPRHHPSSLSERIDKARAENPQNNVPKQDVSQTKKQEQEI